MELLGHADGKSLCFLRVIRAQQRTHHLIGGHPLGLKRVRLDCDRRCTIGRDYGKISDAELGKQLRRANVGRHISAQCLAPLSANLG